MEDKFTGLQQINHGVEESLVPGVLDLRVYVQVYCLFVLDVGQNLQQITIELEVGRKAGLGHHILQLFQEPHQVVFCQLFFCNFLRKRLT